MLATRSASSNYAGVTCVLRLLRLYYALHPPALRRLFVTLTHYADSEPVENFVTHFTLTVTASRSIAIALRPQKIELRFCCVLRVSTALDERSGSVVRSGPGAPGL